MNVYEIITDRIVSQLEKGTVPWQKPWSGMAASEPRNLVSKKGYRGINAFLTDCQGYTSPYWLSFKQAGDLGGKIKTGEKGTPVIFWNWVKKGTGKQDPVTDAELLKNIPFLRYYTVFNSQQCELPEGKLPLVPDLPDNGLTPIACCERIAAKMPNAPAIRYGEQRAYYRPSTDSVNMPKFGTFRTAEAFYSTLFHELTHATGHEKRLNRSGITDATYFGTSNYSKEELVAEMGAAFLCGTAGIENRTTDNSAAYIASWLRQLRKDTKLVIVAAAQAQKAADYILHRQTTQAID